MYEYMTNIDNYKFPSIYSNKIIKLFEKSKSHSLFQFFQFNLFKNML